MPEATKPAVTIWSTDCHPAIVWRFEMVCPICFQLGMTAVNYELNQLVKHIATRHPKEAALVGVGGTIALLFFGPKLWRAIAR
jgi:hypothetical protein